MAFTVIWKDRGVVVNLTDNVCIDEVNDVSEIIFSDKRFRQCQYQIFDFLDSNTTSISLDETHVSVAKGTLVSNIINNPSLAVVTNNNTLTALAEHYIHVSTQLGIKWDIKIFSSREDAERWCAGSK